MADEQLINIYNHFVGRVSPSFRNASMILRHIAEDIVRRHANPLTRCGAKVYSQNDEDGITFEILRRLGRESGVFAEFGVGNGTENNTLALAACGWRGFWCGGEDLAFDWNPRKAARLGFHYAKAWITRANILELYRDGLAAIGAARCDLISLDLDGNDYHFIDDLLARIEPPDVFIAEYNARFLPPIRFVMPYDEAHSWKHDDYYGASLASITELMQRHGYFLACCNAMGCNAFFVRNRFQDLFRDVTGTVAEKFAAPKYFMLGLDYAGHPASMRTIESFFAALNP